MLSDEKRWRDTRPNLRRQGNVIQKKKKSFVSLSQNRQANKAENQNLLVDMAVPYNWFVVADMVPYPCSPEAFSRYIPLPAAGGTDSQWFYCVAHRPDWFDFGIP
jgi:hypothetical protein